jgi:hypothetical protein
MSPFNRFVCLFPPSLQRVPWPLLAEPCGSPPSSVLWVRKTARHPSVPPLVDPRVARTFDPYRGVASWCEGDGEPSWVPGQPLWNMPWVMRHRRPRHNLAKRLLPDAAFRRSENVGIGTRMISVLILTACYLAVYASHPPVAR